MIKFLVSSFSSLFLIATIPAAVGAPDTPAHADSPAPRTILIMAGDTLRFNVAKIEAHPGELLRVQYRNTGSVPKESMGHNWILLDSESEAVRYTTAALTKKSEGYQAADLGSHVIASIPLLGPGETGETTFNAPAKPGRYPYICSFPGHKMAGMHGELIVK